MGWRSRRWSDREPRPKAAKLARSELEQLHASASRLVEGSALLKDLVPRVQLARGRLYLWRGQDDLMARVTPLSSGTMLLEAPRRNGWSEHGRGPLRAVLGKLERDTEGTFHGLGALVRKPKGGKPRVQEVLQRDFGVPGPVLAEPRHWYEMHRKPVIAEADPARERILVRFESFGPFGDFHGTCLYARVGGEWGCYTIKPSASGSIASAEAWLVKPPVGGLGLSVAEGHGCTGPLTLGATALRASWSRNAYELASAARTWVQCRPPKAIACASVFASATWAGLAVSKRQCRDASSRCHSFAP